MSGSQDYTLGTFTLPGVVAVVRVAAIDRFSLQISLKNPMKSKFCLLNWLSIWMLCIWIYLSFHLNGWFDYIDWIERCEISSIIYVTVSTYSVFNLKSEAEYPMILLLVFF